MRWKDHIANTFKDSFSENSINQLLGKLGNYNVGNTNQNNIDELTSDLVNIYIETAQTVGLCKKIKEHRHGQNTRNRRYPQKDWFDGECESMRKEYMNFKNEGRYIRGKKAKKKHRDLLSDKHSKYKKFLRKKRIFIE